MNFEQIVRVPLERVAVIIGKDGTVKRKFENACGVEMKVDSEGGMVTIKAQSLELGDPLKAISLVEAVGRGFSPQRALRLVEEDTALEIIDLRGYAGKSENSLERIKGRIIGLHGKSRRLIEELTGCSISVYGRTVSVIGEVSEVKLASDAIRMIASGSRHRSVYNMLQKARTRKKMERMALWEGETPEFLGKS
jgi:ribosomal RNA assembly protein